MGVVQNNNNDRPPRWVGPAFDPASIITFSSASSHRSQEWQAKTMTAGQLRDILIAIRAGRKGEGDVWAPATFDGGQRKASTALGTFVATFDSDGGTPLAELELACDMTGWYMVIIPSSGWGSTVSEISGDAYDAWKKDRKGADTGIERYLIEVLHKTPAVAKGAKVIADFDLVDQGKDGQRTLRKILRVEHNPCEKYRILVFLSQRYDLSTTAGRRAWKRYYDAACDVLGLPLDRTSGSVERLLFQSRLPPELIDQAKAHIRIIEGGTVDLTGLPAPKPRERTRRGPASFGDEKVHGRGSDDEVLEYHWIDPVTGADIDLRKWAATGMAELPLADILQAGEWPLDDRGEQDGKLHIDCPFKGQHTSLAGGGAFVSNAADFERSGMVDRQKAAVIHCSHHSCRDRDRLEFITEFLRSGALTTAHLYAARDAARAAELAADFEPIEDQTDIKPLIKPSFDWTRETIETRLPQLKRLSAEDPETYETFKSAWDIADTLPADELDLMVDMAENDTDRIEKHPADRKKAGNGVSWRSKLIRNEKGTPNTGTKNLTLTLEHGLNLGACVGYNLLKQRVEIRDPAKLGWGHKGEKARPWADHDDTFAAALAEDELQGVIKPHSITPIIEAIARRHAFHPVRDYLNAVVWDGMPRIDTLLIEHAHVEDTPYARAIIARTLIGAVARVMKPGAKMDTALILESEQGYKKSSLFSALAGDPEHFVDNLPGHLGDKSVAEIIATHWIAEMGELSNVKKGELDKTKAFMSRTHDSFRPAYGRRVVNHPRQCILTGTVNGETIGYLRDLTGNRRFWTLKVGRINLSAIVKMRDQIWAEAVHRFKAGERWWFDDETEAHLIEAQQNAAAERTEEPELVETVRRFISHKPGISGHDQDVLAAWTERKVPLTVIPTIASFFNAIGKQTRNITFSDKVAFKQALQALGWTVRQQRATDQSLLGLARSARYFVAPEAGRAVSMVRWIKLQLKRGAVAGQDDIPRLEDGNVIYLEDPPRPPRKR